MQEPTFLILTALAAGPQHGYGIITDVVQISGERIRLQAGTLYAALDRLQGEGLVETDREEVVDGRARRYYRLTSEGEARLAVEAGHLRRNADTAASRLRGGLRPAFSMKPAPPRWEAGLATSFGSAT
ncbi:PadR family transcriptional regulator [Sphaerisporangium fuscum]|uniref:PadR family transcriptional regulator n=1 Tax=Sphaerisporangium fuscum TaxID=2835868 RepID=UPI001BDC8900|nr:helix-turn-helix transcriptional regulator [Sphaerisporangium fuscum]